MFKRFLSIFSIISIFLLTVNSSFTQTKNNWSAVESLVNQEVAIKTKSGMKYGIIKSVDSDSLTIRIAGKKRMTQNETEINKININKLWRALLFVNQRNTAKGAVIGAGVGSLALGVPAIAEGSDDGLAGAGFFLGAIGGAAVGGLVGFFTKKKHKKRDLIYKK